ncbi:ABC transporter ATP-binding protein [Limibacter armeniacum]|uniref:ABC transporter ATP-binding protein n=1 Tax=Limibacter armeniacum TaxID=466084 RepID=UPI002FE5DF5D
MLRVNSIEKRFDKQDVLKKISFSLSEGEVLAVLGKSGCGKTTLLKVLAGLESQDLGEISWDNQPVHQLSAAEREMVYVFQEPMLFPHLNVFENIAFGLRIRKYSETEVQQKVDRMIMELALEGHERKLPSQLSGGQKQRVAFGRAVVFSPRVLLLDEPFASLDPQTRSTMQQVFLKVARDYQITALFVTHDVKEALVIGDQFALMEDGQFTVYKDKETFVKDPVTGVQRELLFWKEIEHKSIEIR